MRNITRDSRGFTLIAALLLTLLLSAMAVGLMYLVTNEQHMGNNDLEGNVAYYGAEAGIENLTAQLSQLYQQSQSPNATDINALTTPANWPTAVAGSNVSGMTFPQYSVTWPQTFPDGVTPCPGNPPNPCGGWDIVGSGSDQGMVASLIPFTLSVTSQRLSSAGQVGTNVLAATGASVNLTRTVEVALLPAFEFGVFCDGDCDYFAGPNFNFGGRVHTNGNLFLASGANLTFTDKIAAVGQVVVDQLENGWPTNNGYTGNIWAPSASGGCPSAPTAGPGPTPAICIQLTNGSWTGGFPQTGAANPGWKGISTGTAANDFHGFIVNGLTGATKLQLPFVQSNNKVGAIDIIRRPTPNDTALLSNSRLYNKAAIRILLADTQGDLYPGSARADSATQDVQLIAGNAQNVAQTVAPVLPGNMYYAIGDPTKNANFVYPTGCAAAAYPLHGQVTQAGNLCKSVWLRVEYVNAAGKWVGVTTEWLKFGFGRGYDVPPTAPYQSAGIPACPQFGAAGYPPAGQCYNPISPAILILQQLQNGKAATTATGALATANNWLPINLYDAREGEPRDVRPNGDPETSCSPNGVMNVVELDVGNLWLWLQGAAPYAGGSGTLVSTTDQNGTNENGYILYFADHRGMLPDKYPLTPFYNNFSGMSGLNDVVNGTSATGVPDGKLEPITYYASATVPYSPEDTGVKGTLVLANNVDNWGQVNLGAGFGIAAGNMSQPYYISGTTAGIANCTPRGEWNMVTGPRHALRLVDGGMSAKGVSYLPQPIAPATTGNGFTVTSEEPVYVWGDYNSGIADPLWPAGANGTTPHSASAIIADAVTLLSNPPSAATLPTANLGWTDLESFTYPGQATKVNGPPAFPGRLGNNSYYRVAIAAGKSVPFPEPGWANALGWKDFGTDGGMHNFLRYLEDRSDNGNGGTVYYAGSLISMYYSQYATGVFKCCNSVYSAPNRVYFFDTQFLNPNNLPPGTPEFQDVVSLSFHQSFTPQ